MKTMTETITREKIEQIVEGIENQQTNVIGEEWRFLEQLKNSYKERLKDM